MTFNRQAMSQWMEQHRVIEHLQQAIRCNTVNPPGNERPLAENIRLLLASYGIEADLFAVSEAPGRANLIAVIRGERPGKTLVFSGHTDTVPVGENDWRFDPFAAELIDGKLYGRGAADMKGGLYALLYAFIKCKLDGAVAAGELIFAASFGEETGSEGARRMVDERLLTAFDAMVIAEPTDNRLFIAHKGVLWLKVESIGKTAHSSMPDHGINAIMALHQFVERLNGLNLSAAAHPLLTPATLAVTTFKGGLKTNMVPDYGMLTIDLRTLPEHSHNDIYDSVAAIADEVTHSGKGAILKVSRLLDLPGLTTPADAVIVETIRTVVHDGLGRDVEGAGVNYFTDGSVFQELGDGDIVVLGPGKPELAHQPDEYVSISELEESIYIYAQTAAKYLR